MFYSGAWEKTCISLVRKINLLCPAFENTIIWVWTFAYCNSDLHEYLDISRCGHVRNVRNIKPTQSITEVDWSHT